MAAIARFDYSDAMRDKAALGLAWGAEPLDRYIADLTRSFRART